MLTGKIHWVRPSVTAPVSRAGLAMGLVGFGPAPTPAPVGVRRMGGGLGGPCPGQAGARARRTARVGLGPGGEDAGLGTSKFNCSGDGRACQRSPRIVSPVPRSRLCWSSPEPYGRHRFEGGPRSSPRSGIRDDSALRAVPTSHPARRRSRWGWARGCRFPRDCESIPWR